MLIITLTHETNLNGGNKHGDHPYWQRIPFGLSLINMSVLKEVTLIKTIISAEHKVSLTLGYVPTESLRV